MPGDEDDTQDLLFIGNDTFFAGESAGLSRLLHGLRKGGGSCNPRRNPYVAWDLITHPRAAYNLLTGRRPIPAIADIRWFSVAPFRLGDGIVKYGAFPLRQQAQYGRPGSTSYYLQQRLSELLDPANNNHLCLTLKVQQRHDAEKRSRSRIRWWHGASRPRPGARSPPSTSIRRLSAAATSRNSASGLTFNPWDGLQGAPAGRRHQPRAPRRHAGHAGACG